MTALILDAGALIALDRNSRSVWADFDAAIEAGTVVHAPAGAVGQAWRNGKRQVLLARALQNCEEPALSGQIARSAGELCGRTGTEDVIDASVAIEAAEASKSSDVLLFTSDAGDMRLLLTALNAAVQVVQV